MGPMRTIQQRAGVQTARGQQTGSEPLRSVMRRDQGTLSFGPVCPPGLGGLQIAGCNLGAHSLSKIKAKSGMVTCAEKRLGRRRIYGEGNKDVENVKNFPTRPTVMKGQPLRENWASGRVHPFSGADERLG